MEFPLCTMSAEVSAFPSVLAAAIRSLPVSILRSLTRIGDDLNCNNDFIIIISNSSMICYIC